MPLFQIFCILALFVTYPVLLLTLLLSVLCCSCNLSAQQSVLNIPRGNTDILREEEKGMFAENIVKRLDDISNLPPTVRNNKSLLLPVIAS